MLLFVELLAVLSIAAAFGTRIALPLLMIGLMQGDRLWDDVPLLQKVHPSIVLGVLVSWSLLELVVFRDRKGQRILQSVELLFAPFVGAIAALTVANSTDELSGWLTILSGVLGGLMAFVLQLFQTGLFYRSRPLPLWGIFAQDFLCVCLVLFAFDAPQQGGLIALLLLWLVLRTSYAWRRWYLEQGGQSDRTSPRRTKRDPD